MILFALIALNKVVLDLDQFSLKPDTIEFVLHVDWKRLRLETI